MRWFGWSLDLSRKKLRRKVSRTCTPNGAYVLWPHIYFRPLYTQSYSAGLTGLGLLESCLCLVSQVTRLTSLTSWLRLLFATLYFVYVRLSWRPLEYLCCSFRLIHYTHDLIIYSLVTYYHSLSFHSFYPSLLLPQKKASGIMTADIDSETARLDPTLPTVEKPVQYQQNNEPRKGLHPAFFIMLVKQPGSALQRGVDDWLIDGDRAWIALSSTLILFNKQVLGYGHFGQSPSIYLPTPLYSD